MHPPPLLEINNLCVDFESDAGLVRAVDRVSLVLQKGQTLGIVGESGSGKSVTALSVMRLMADAGKISDGEIWFSPDGIKNIDLLNASNLVLQQIRGNNISMIFQEPMTSLNPVQKCGRQVCESMIIHEKVSFKDAKNRTLELFDEVLLPRPYSVFNSYPHQLSGGQKQRVMIAMAVSCNPVLLIADEPTTALDVTVQKSILAQMKRLQQKF
ncbi:MAG: ABC transporter ATP-binding protein, partial [Bacteroidales bacterium]|nr:ABC transporter ATP-binding protein [Bacteroidales bacterium]